MYVKWKKRGVKWDFQGGGEVRRIIQYCINDNIV